MVLLEIRQVTLVPVVDVSNGITVSLIAGAHLALVAFLEARLERLPLVRVQIVAFSQSGSQPSRMLVILVDFDCTTCGFELGLVLARQRR